MCLPSQYPPLHAIPRVEEICEDSDEDWDIGVTWQATVPEEEVEGPPQHVQEAQL